MDTAIDFFSSFERPVCYNAIGFVARAGKRTSQADDVVGSALTVCLAGSKRGRGRIDVAAINVSLSRARP